MRRRLTVAVVAGLLAHVVVAAAGGPAPTPGDRVLMERVRQVLARTPLIDGHNDLAENLRDDFGNRLERIDLAASTAGLADPLQTDIPRLRKGLVGAQVWAAFVSTDLHGPEAVQVLFEQLDVIRRMVARYPETFGLALTADDIERLHRSGKIASLIGIEGGHAIGNSLAVLRQASLCGARYLTLTHWKSIAWADAGTDSAHHNGLTPFGREVVREMNRLGMMVDLSHVSDKVMLDAMETSAAPVIFSHSSARALCNHPRNVPDDILRRVAAADGIVMVNFAPGFVTEAARQYDEVAWPEHDRLARLYPTDPLRVKAELAAWRAEHPAPVVTLADVANHIDHIRKVAGIDHVGIGSDFEGIGRTPAGLEDVSCYPALLAELLRRGYTDEDLAKVAGGNFLRVMRAVEKTASRLQRERRPSDALIEDVDRPAVPVAEHGGVGGAPAH